MVKKNIKTKKLLKKKYNRRTKKVGGAQAMKLKDLTLGIQLGQQAKQLRKQKYNSISVKIKFIITSMIPYDEKLNERSLLSHFSPSSYSLKYKSGAVFSVKLYGDMSFIYDETETYDVFNFLLIRYIGFNNVNVKRNNVIIRINNIKYFSFISRFINSLLCEGFIVKENPSELLEDPETGIIAVRKEIYFGKKN